MYKCSGCGQELTHKDADCSCSGEGEGVVCYECGSWFEEEFPICPVCGGER